MVRILVVERVRNLFGRVPIDPIGLPVPHRIGLGASIVPKASEVILQMIWQWALALRRARISTPRKAT